MHPVRVAPVLRYHGGKHRLASWICEHFPAHRTYVEPFGGAASVLMRKARSYAEVYNDLDGEVVNVFRVLRDPTRAAELERRLILTPFSRREFVDAHERARDPVEAARQTIARSFMGFGGKSTGARTPGTSGFRAKSSMAHSTQATAWARWPDNVPAFVDRLRGVVIEQRPALEILAQHDAPDTLFYVDPPYPFSTRGDERPDYNHELTDNDHRALGSALRSLRGAVVLSGYACALYDVELFPDWIRHERRALSDGARERTEILWLNPACAELLEPAPAFAGFAL